MKRILIFLAFIPLLAYAGPSVVLSWYEADFKGLKIGEAYNLNELRKPPFQVINNQRDNVVAKVKVIKPEAKQLKAGYEAIPDISWVKLDEESLMIRGRDMETEGINLSIPDDKKYMGNKYCFCLVVETSSVKAQSMVFLDIKK
jgi:hypothetical protein